MPDELIPPTPPPVFYSITPEAEPAPVPLYKKRHFGMIIGAVVLAMVAGGFVIALAANMIRANQQAKAVVAEKKSAVADMVQNGIPQSEAARTAGFADGCTGLSGAEYADCLSIIALDAGTIETCASLTGEEQAKCADGANLAKAIKDGRYALCAQVADATLRTGCEAIVTEQARTDKDCAGHGVPAEECVPSAGATALASGDIKACDTLPDTERSGCLDGFFSIDTDQDGLSDGEELTKYLTDPKKADTDGDGYTDGQEVLSGHDPLKK